MSSTETFTPPSDTPKRSHKKTILFSILGAVIAVGFAVMTYAILATPARQPYRDAKAQYQNVYNANIAVITAGSALNASSATDAEFNKSLTLITNSLDGLELETKQLGKEEVLEKGQGKTLYDALNKKITAYIAYNRSVVASMKKVRPVVYACSQTMTDVTASEVSATALRTCVANLEALQDISDADYKKYVTDSIPVYQKIAATVEQRAELADPDGADAATDKTLSDTQDDLIDSLEAVSTSFSTNVSKSKSAVDITDAAKALDDYLSGKSSTFSV